MLWELPPRVLTDQAPTTSIQREGSLDQDAVLEPGYLHHKAPQCTSSKLVGQKGISLNLQLVRCSVQAVLRFANLRSARDCTSFRRQVTTHG